MAMGVKRWRILVLMQKSHVAGSTFSVFYLVKAWVSRGHFVVVGCEADSLLYQLVEEERKRLSSLSSPQAPLLVPMTIRSRWEPPIMREIVRMVKKWRIDIINTQSSYDEFACIFAARIYGMKGVWILRTRRQMPKSWSLPFLKILTWGLPHALIAVSSGVKRALIRRGADGKKVHVLWNGTPKEKYQQNEAQKRWVEEKKKAWGDLPVIGCVSRWKKQHQLLQALLLLPDSMPCVALFIGISEPPAYIHWRKEAEKKGHKVVYIGEVDNAVSTAYLRGCAMKVLCSTMEGFSQSILEAMMLGVPVIATEAGGNTDLISHQKNGLLFKDKDIKGLASLIMLLLKDESMAQRLATQAKQQAETTHSMEAVAKRYEQLFLHLHQSLSQKRKSAFSTPV